MDARTQPSVSICTRFIPSTKKRRKKPLPHICRCWVSWSCPCHPNRSASCLRRKNCVECVMPTCQTPCHRHLPVTCSSSASIAEEEVLRTWPILGKVTLKASRSLTHHKCSPPHHHGTMGDSHASNSRPLSIDHRLPIFYYQIRRQDSGKSRNRKGSWKYHKSPETNSYTLQSVRSTLLENDQGYLSTCDWQCKCEQDNLIENT